MEERDPKDTSEPREGADAGGEDKGKVETDEPKDRVVEDGDATRERD